MGIPKRLRKLADKHARVDGIPFELPVKCKNSPVLMAVFPISADRAREVLPPSEIHPFRLWRSAFLVVTVINYRETPIGEYIEYSIAIACTHGLRPAPRLLPLLFRRRYGLGQYVLDLPVSTEISVKGGKGIWGMPKHQASLDFRIDEDRQRVSSQYDLDGRLATYIEIDRPGRSWLPVRMAAANYCGFRGMLMRSTIYFRTWAGFCLGPAARARFIIGDHPRVEPLKRLGIGEDPIATLFMPATEGTLDDHFECWFLTYDRPPGEATTEGLESVIDLGLSEQWPPPPSAPVPGIEKPAAAAVDRSEESTGGDAGR